MSDEKDAKTRQLLVVFAKTPVAGRVKTRIGAVAGAEQALTIYEAMLEKILAESAANESWRQLIVITPESDEAYFARRGFEVMRQCGADIGERMSNALTQGFQSGASRVILIGSDIPTLTRAEIADAFSLLNDVPAIIGPSADGGFYLFGVKAEHCIAAAGVLKGCISWSTPLVIDEVRLLCRKVSLPLSYLPVKRDIDTFADWLDYQESLNGKD